MSRIGVREALEALARFEGDEETAKSILLTYDAGKDAYLSGRFKLKFDLQASLDSLRKVGVSKEAALDFAIRVVREINYGLCSERYCGAIAREKGAEVRGYTDTHSK